MQVNVINVENSWEVFKYCKRYYILFFSLKIYISASPVEGEQPLGELYNVEQYLQRCGASCR